jgi:gluconolactonase
MRLKVIMKKKLNLYLISLILGTLPALAQGQEVKQILPLYSEFSDIVPADARVEKLADNPGKGTLEGPVWVRKGGYLVFSDMAGKVTDKWDPADGKVSLFLDHSGPNGATLDKQGRLVYCAVEDRQIVRVEEDGRRTVLASEYEGKGLNAPNDLIYKSDGSLYFTDATTRAPGTRDGKADPKLLPYYGVFLLKDGKLKLVINDMSRPNGLALSPDEKYLYVDDTLTKDIKRFEVLPDDTLGTGEVITKMFSDLPHLPDGMKIDTKGNLYNIGPGGVWVMSPDGRLLGIILVPTMPANLTFGEDDGKALFMTAPSGLYRIRLKIPGIRP